MHEARPPPAVMNPAAFCLLLLAVVGAAGEGSDEDLFQCPEETSRVLHPRGDDDTTVTWRKSFPRKKRVLTEPLCLGPHGEVLSRLCLRNGSSRSPSWVPDTPPTCHRTQPSYKQADKCPAPYRSAQLHDARVCLLVTEPRRYSDACLASGYENYVLDLHHDEFDDLMGLLRESGVWQVWLPVQRHEAYGPLLLRLPGARWGTRFKVPGDLAVSWAAGRSSLQGECLRLNVPVDADSDATLETDACRRPLSEVCHLKLSKKIVTQLACPEDSFTSLYSGEHQTTCLGVNYGTTTWADAGAKCSELGGHLATIPSPFQNYLLEEILDDSKLDADHSHCWIGLRRKESGGGFEWSVSGNKSVDVQYVNWDEDEDHSESDGKGAVDKEGSWKLVDDPTLDCFICQFNASVPHTTFSLRHNYESNKLIFSVFSPRGLWKRSSEDRGFNCFTDSSGTFINKVNVISHWHKHWTVGNLPAFSSFDVNNVMSDININMETSVYILNLNRNSGHYWCEGHMVSSFQLERSKKILIFGSRPGHLFSLVVDIHGICNITLGATICDSTFSDIYAKIAKDIKGTIENKSTRTSVSDIRPLKIIDFSDNGTLRLVLHLRLNIRGFKDEFVFKDTLLTLKKILSSNRSYYSLVSFLSTEGCPESITEENSQVLHWDFTQFGYTAVPKEICLNKHGIPVHRKCEGSFLLGGVWGETTGSCSDNNGSLITTRLQNLVNESERGRNKSSTEIAVEISQLTTENFSWLVPADIYYLARVMQNLARISSETLSSSDDIFELEAITRIIDCVNEADRQTVQMSQDFLNSTNMLLDALDSILNFITLTARIEENKGVILCVTPQVVVQISDPTQSNISGLAITRKKETTFYTKNFNDYDIVPLNSNETMDSIMFSDDIEVATWVPDELLNQIITSDNSTANCSDSANIDLCESEQPYELRGRKPFVVIFVLYDDILFHSRHQYHRTENRSDSLVGSRVVSVSIPGLESDLPVPISIFFRPLINSTENAVPNAHKCAFWDFSFNSSSPSLSLGGWSSEGCFFAGSSTGNDSSAVDVCLCTHLTHFAELVLGPMAYEWQESRLSSEAVLNPKVVYLLKHQKALDIISITGCSLSLLGILGIIVTAAVFRSWRDKPGTKILLQLALAIGLQMTTFLIANTETTFEVVGENDSNDTAFDDNLIVSSTNSNSSTSNDGAATDEILCIVGGVIRHYSIMCGFTWMLVTAFLQFQRYVKVLGNTRPNRFFLKAALFGWGVPVIPVAILLIITPQSYVPPYKTSMCYPTGIYLYAGVVFPASIIISINFIVFVKVINSIMRGPDGKLRSTPDRGLILSQLRLGVLLFSLLGLSWFFGLMLVVSQNVVFSFLFCLTATTQGLVAFLFFVVCDPSTRHLWTSLVSMWAKIAWRLTIKNTKGLSKKATASNNSGKETKGNVPAKTAAEENAVTERKIGTN
ncbi:uncharacterized protein LOC134528487 [Bacillus rossius redtenbacheri]|uniref:uncharacterized protein LOC134528487 n=1 Tax=Bacillus rossius redtenbacheri TaxID=93214 RepID=UPI002FDE790D